MRAGQLEPADGRTTTDAEVANAPGWWESAAVWRLIAAASLLPFLFTPVPPISDLFNHVGRYHVMLHPGEGLERYYSFRWGLLPNLGQDLVVAVLGRWLGAENAAYLATALIAPATILAIGALSRRLQGAVQPASLLALPFAFSFPFLFGFVNYATGLALTLWSAVAWHASERWPPWRRGALLAGLALAVWVCHLAAWSVLLITIGALEAARWLAAPSLRGGVRTALLLMPAVLLPLLVGHFWQIEGKAHSSVLRDIVSHAIHASPKAMMFKVRMLGYTLRDQSRALDLFSQAAILTVALIAFALAKMRVHGGAAFGAVCLFAMFWILSTSLMGGYWVDLRLLPMVAILALLSLPGARGRAGQGVAAFALALFALRLLVMTVGWHQTGTALAADLKALDRVPRGSRIATLAAPRFCAGWADDGTTELASLAIPRRDAFVNSEWDIAGQQLMQPIYNRAVGYNSALSHDLAFGPDCAGATLDGWLAALPRDRFDFVWLMGPAARPVRLDWLVPVWRGPSATLYRVLHLERGSATPSP